MPAPWLPETFHHPARVEILDGYHIRPIRASDIDIDYKVVTDNQAMLWSIYGEAWHWPPPGMTREQDEADVARHAQEMVDHASFNYAIFPTDESALLGCIYIDPPAPGDDTCDAEVSWWTAADAPAPLRGSLSEFVPHWLRSTWPLRRISYPFNPPRS